MRRFLLLILTFAMVSGSVSGQQRDRLADLGVQCYLHGAVAPDGSLWLGTACGYLYRADNIHSPWRTMVEPPENSWRGITFESVAPFNRNVAVAVGYHLDNGVLRVSGTLWNDTVPAGGSRKWEWFHPTWRGEGGRVWAGSQDGLLTFSGYWTPLAVVAAAALAMAVFTYFSEKKGMEWLDNFSIAGSMLVGMLAAVLIGR